MLSWRIKPKRNFLSCAKAVKLSQYTAGDVIDSPLILEFCEAFGHWFFPRGWYEKRTFFFWVTIWDPHILLYTHGMHLSLATCLLARLTFLNSIMGAPVCSVLQTRKCMADNICPTQRLYQSQKDTCPYQHIQWTSILLCCTVQQTFVQLDFFSMTASEGTQDVHQKLIVWFWMVGAIGKISDYIDFSNKSTGRLWFSVIRSNQMNQ